MAANLISVTSWTKLDYQNSPYSVATAIGINADKIISVTTRATALNTTGITDIVYELPFNQMNYQPVLTVTQTAAAIQAAISSSIAGTSGRATLVAGTVTVSVPGLTAANNVVVSLLTANTTTLTTEYQAVAGTDSIVIRANVAAGTINTADISTLIWAVVG